MATYGQVVMHVMEHQQEKIMNYAPFLVSREDPDKISLNFNKKMVVYRNRTLKTRESSKKSVRKYDKI